jgi:outer membrane protein TolC
VPLHVRDVATPRVAEKSAARHRIQLERALRVQEARYEAEATALDVRARYTAATALATELLPAMRAHLTATETAYARGETDILQVFRARERLFAAEQADLAARHAYHVAATRRRSSACCLPL